MQHVSVYSAKVGATPIKSIESNFYSKFGKRLFDVVFAIILLPILLPVIAILWVLVRLDGGPGFFGHQRVGKNGEQFRCWKIRSMVVDAEERLKEHLAVSPAASAEWAATHKLNDDPRISRIGHFIRKTSLDELPQIWNVLRGEMSFVGPRPVVTDELEKYGDLVNYYLAQTPGITGLWQVSGRNDISYDERVLLDKRYLGMRSLQNDIKIICMTGGAVLNVTGK